MSGKKCVGIMPSSWQRQLAKEISQIENMAPAALAAAASLPLDRERVQVIGITGPPGGGKSTLCNQLLQKLGEKARVAALLVDPSSPYSGGAILGDRIRMQALVSNPNIYIRSLSNRGNPGGVGSSVVSILRAVMARDFSHIIIETVGAGQSEVKIASIADTVLVVSVPNLGDDIQAVKSGILEIADIFVINKADLPGADSLYTALRESAQRAVEGWTAPLCQTVAHQGIGIDALIEEIERHRQWLLDSDRLLQKRRNAAKFEVAELSRVLLEKHLEKLPTAALAGYLSHRGGNLLKKLDAAYAEILNSLEEV